MVKTVIIKPFSGEKSSDSTYSSISSKKQALACPSCSEALEVAELCCPLCKVSVRGSFPQNPFLRLSPEEQSLLLEFLLCGGRLKDLAAKLGHSYPTVRKRLDALIAVVREASHPIQERADKRKRILALLEKKQLTLEAAEEILNKLM